MNLDDLNKLTGAEKITGVKFSEVCLFYKLTFRGVSFRDVLQP